jgi:hypothetical protein
MRYGLDGFRPFATADLILGKFSNIPYFVGSDPADPPPPDSRGVLHTVTFTNVTIGLLKYFTVQLRLFAHSGTAENGMPYYEVVVGAEGKRKIVQKSPAQKLPKIIHL